MRKHSNPIARIASMVITVGTLALVASTAQAQEQFRADTWNRASLSGGLRFGTDDLNVGFGAHGGYTIEPGIYVGGLFDYYLGNDAFSAWMLMAEVGYDFGVADKLILRPVFDLGVVGASLDFECPPGTEDFCDDATSSTDLEAGLGGHVIYNLGPVTLGGEIRFLFAELSTFIIGANIGVVL